MDAIAGTAGRWTPRVVQERCIIWTNMLEPIERDRLVENVTARGYYIRCETADQETLWRTLPLASHVVLHDLCGLVDTLADCIDLSSRLRAHNVELVVIRPKREPTPYDVQHGRVVSLIRSLQRLSPRLERNDTPLEHYWHYIKTWSP